MNSELNAKRWASATSIKSVILNTGDEVEIKSISFEDLAIAETAEFSIADEFKEYKLLEVFALVVSEAKNLAACLERLRAPLQIGTMFLKMPDNVIAKSFNRDSENLVVEVRDSISGMKLCLELFESRMQLKKSSIGEMYDHIAFVKKMVNEVKKELGE